MPSSRNLKVMQRYIAAHGNPIGDHWCELFELRELAGMFGGLKKREIARLAAIAGPLDLDALDAIEVEEAASGDLPENDPDGTLLSYAYLRPTADLTRLRRTSEFSSDDWREIFGNRLMNGQRPFTPIPAGADLDDIDLDEDTSHETSDIGSCGCPPHTAMKKLLAVCRKNGGLLPEDCMELQAALDAHDWDDTPRPTTDRLLAELRIAPPWASEGVTVTEAYE